MLSLDFVSQFVYENLSQVTTSQNGTHFHARCILCGDSKKSLSKKRFHLDFNDGNPIYHCFNCSESGSFLQLYSQLKGLSISQAKKDLYKFNPDNLIQQLSRRKISKVIKEIEHTDHSYIIEDCVSEDRVIDSIVYKSWVNILSEFRKSRYIPEQYDLFLAYKGNYKGRIIVPIYDEDGNMIYFQARKVPNTNVQPKYKNPTLKKGDIIFNKHLFKRDKSIIVTEGLIDAKMIGDQGTSCLGSEITNDFIKRLYSMTDENVVIAFDNDEPGSEALNKFMKDNKYSKRVFYFLTPSEYKDCKDINSCVVKRSSVEGIYEFVMKNSYSYPAAYTLSHIQRS
jgi:hypothetical protein